MAVYEVQGPDGKVYEVDAPDMQTAVSALGSFGAPPVGGSSTNSEAVSDLSSKGAALIDGISQGATFGLYDEMAGLKSGILGMSPTANGTMSEMFDYSGSFGDRYRAGRDQVRDMADQSREQEPVAYGGGEIVGAMAPAALTAPVAGGSTMLNTMARGAALGGVEGGLYGFGTGEGVEDRAKRARNFGLVGAGIGGLAPPVVHGAAKTTGAVRDMLGGGVSTVTGQARQGAANRTMMDTLRKSGRSVADVQDDVARAIAQGQPEFRMMDALGAAGQRRASGIARSGGDGAEDIARFLQQRQIDQPNRIAGFVDDAFGMNGRTAAQTTDALTAARGQAADVAYDAARKGAGPVDVRGSLSVIDDRIGGMRGSNVTGDGIDGALAKFRSRLAADPAPNGEIARELSDFDRVLGVKQDVQDAIGVADRAGRKNEARELGKLSQALDQALEGASDGYRAANDGFRRASQTIGAVDQGAAMSRPSARAADTIPQFQAMTPDQQAAARVGYGDRALAKIEANTSPTANRARAFTSTKAAQEADAMAVDPILFRDRIVRENAMWDTQNRALGGSRTADNLEDIGNLGPVSAGGRAIRDLFTGNFGSAAQNAGAAIGPAVNGQNEATRALIAKMLMSSEPEKALQQALRQDMSSQSKRRMVEAMVRGMGRIGTPVN